jgi:two-component system phosphate regulon sensor histidine kinase PhoR
MRRKKLLWKIYPAYLVIILTSIIMVGFYASFRLKHFYLDKTAESLEIRALLIEREVAGTFTRDKSAALDSLCKTLGKAIATRITLIRPTGEVVGDTDNDPRMMENHADRPEVRKALSGSTGVSTRYSDTLKKDMMYVAIPLRNKGEIVGVVRTAIPVHEIDIALHGIYWKIALFGLSMTLLAAGITLSISRRLSATVEDMRLGAQRFASGELNHKVLLPDSEELASLAEALNRMAKQIGDRIRISTDQQNELEAVLSAMREGIIAIDAEDRILRINHAAGTFLEIDTTTVRSKTVQEVIRKADILRFIGGLTSNKQEREAEIILRGSTNKFLNLRASVLRDDKEKNIGVLVVLNDITRLRQLEDMRREFVSNVSHELKTPITSIKGYVETLQEGAIDDAANSKKFLDVIAKQADLLNALIDDLLSLSQIERKTERDEIELEKRNAKTIVASAIAAYATRSHERDIEIMLQSDDGVEIQANSLLLEQAIGNLLDNAIKYSEPGNTVDVEVSKAKDEVTIIVRDHGVGIAPEHLPRLFERFYRVDKGRSRAMGGTGLGLAIVKHIIQAHGGRVSVNSTPGKGSAFTLHLPIH